MIHLPDSVTWDAIVDLSTVDQLSSRPLFACLVREIGQVHDSLEIRGAHLLVRLPLSGHTLRARLSPGTSAIAPRFVGSVEGEVNGTFQVLSTDDLAAIAVRELSAVTDVVNLEFADQVRESHAALAAMVGARKNAVPPVDPYLASEQALLSGHPRHPSPKARQGKPETWLRYAPEAHARFPLMFLSVDRELLHEQTAEAMTEESDAFAHGSPVPASGESDFAMLPVHPWQWQLLERHGALRQALDDGRVAVVGPGSHDVVPTSSLRTVYLPDADMFLKFSLDVRITNCLRKLSWYELIGAVTLTDVLAPVFSEIRCAYPDASLLLEPAARTITLNPRDDGRGDLRTFEGLGVIARQGIGRHAQPGTTPLLAAALVEEHFARWLPADADEAAAWWDAYVQNVMGPTLLAYVEHGIVLEPHLQNVIIGLAPDGLPRQAVFRDLEGVKLVDGHPTSARLPTLPTRVVTAMTYSTEGAWQRVAYCLFVNNLAEMAAALSARCPSIAPSVWPAVKKHLDAFISEHGASPSLRAMCDGAPLPAKANLGLRWLRNPDSAATYVSLPNPIIGDDVFCGSRIGT